MCVSWEVSVVSWWEGVCYGNVNFVGVLFKCEFVFRLINYMYIFCFIKLKLNWLILLLKFDWVIDFDVFLLVCFDFGKFKIMYKSMFLRSWKVMMIVVNLSIVFLLVFICEFVFKVVGFFLFFFDIIKI